MKLTMYQVDAFADRVFTGNPAAICPLDAWLDEATMQAIARENNLAETAYFVREGDVYGLRWFTPTAEVDLCGHATLASAYVLRECLQNTDDTLNFDTRSGRLTVEFRDGKYVMDFPSRPPKPCEPDPVLVEALGTAPETLMASVRDYFAIYPNEATLAALKPNMFQMSDVDRFAVICTAPGDNVDFVSRFFAPKQGVPEDPVTGSAHTTLIPYWAERLGKTELRARQISPRGGDVWCEHKGDRVTIAGNGVLYLEGSIEI